MSTFGEESLVKGLHGSGEVSQCEACVVHDSSSVLYGVLKTSQVVAQTEGFHRSIVRYW